ncbi:transcriptional regulator [Haematobacter massiliensis]|uniref:helix-turn-helix transcriptional regulator n=1 Tax=Haematobacter massiliensis TaxID=195105 RepID=UPI000B49C403|nr:transcriptional regulator [Haematobacter massiliensis]OWJ72510.1 transcriptional regulator [Haematobacter massiliensis]
MTAPRQIQKGRDARVAGNRPPSYVSKATLAAELDLSESTIDSLVDRGILPKPIRLGGSVRWCWAQVDASLSPLSGPMMDEFMSGIGNVT